MYVFKCMEHDYLCSLPSQCKIDTVIVMIVVIQSFTLIFLNIVLLYLGLGPQYNVCRG